jgi:ketosteroid isomerase-like protein
MDSKKTIETFYDSFSKGDALGMQACYHPDIMFQDEVFGKLEGERVFQMWDMLLSSKKNTILISLNHSQADAKEGTAQWDAQYTYGPSNRKVLNRVDAYFKFENAKIIEHVDRFSLWKWSSQALGLPGLLLGWTPYMKRRIRLMANSRLDKYINP